MTTGKIIPSVNFIAAAFFTVVLVLSGSGTVCPALAENPDITAEVKNEKIHIGDRILLEVTAPASRDLEYIFPEKPGETGEFTVFSSRTFSEGFGKTARRGREYVMGIYTTGTHVIPPVKVLYRKDGDEGWLQADSNQVPVVIDSVLTGDERDIKDIKGVARYGGAAAGIFVFGVSLAALIFLLLVLWFRQRGSSAEFGRKTLAPHEIAYRELDMLKDLDLPGKGLVKEYYSRLSWIIREYIENRFLLRAPEMTTEEFMEEASRANELDDGQKALLAEFLCHCDMVKFAKYGPTPLEMLDSYKAARNFVDQTRPAEEESAGGGEAPKQ